MQTRAYLTSTFIGSAIIFVWQVISGVLSIFFVRQTIGQVMGGPGEMPPDNISGLVAGGLLFACAGLVVVGLIYLGSGALYVYLHTRREAITTEQSMLGGAASAASISLVSAIASALLSLLTRPMMLRAVNEVMPGNMPPGNLPPQGVAFSVVSGFAGACIGIVIAAILGLAGGIVGRALFGDDEQ
ncbi:MAG TPA: hypothetical protein ENJ02_11165 [Chloroflexi bacterium]|nr:hypothetical protein [Chloroflexota bacterium]